MPVAAFQTGVVVPANTYAADGGVTNTTVTDAAGPDSLGVENARDVPAAAQSLTGVATLGNTGRWPPDNTPEPRPLHETHPWSVTHSRLQEAYQYLPEGTIVTRVHVPYEHSDVPALWVTERFSATIEQNSRKRDEDGNRLEDQPLYELRTMDGRHIPL